MVKRAVLILSMLLMVAKANYPIYDFKYKTNRAGEVESATIDYDGFYNMMFELDNLRTISNKAVQYIALDLKEDKTDIIIDTEDKKTRFKKILKGDALKIGGALLAGFIAGILLNSKM